MCPERSRLVRQTLDPREIGPSPSPQAPALSPRLDGHSRDGLARSAVSSRQGAGGRGGSQGAHGRSPRRQGRERYNIYGRYILYTIVHIYRTPTHTDTHALWDQQPPRFRGGREEQLSSDNPSLWVPAGGHRPFQMLLLQFSFLPIQKAKCYHSNRTMFKMSLLHST